MYRAVLVAALVAATPATGPGGPHPLPGATLPGPALYVVNQAGASISVIDQDQLVVDTVLDLTRMGFTANAKPHHVAVEPDGSYWYVTLIGDGRVLKLDRANHVVGQVRMETPGLVELDPRRDTLYVGRSMTAPKPPQSVGVIRRSTFTLVDEQEVQIPRPHALVATRDGAWIHTASLAENTIASINAASGRVTLSHIPGPTRTMVQFTVSPDGRWMICGGQVSSTVLVYDLTKAPPLTPAREIAIAGMPWDPVFSPDGRHAYFSLQAGNAVAEVDLAAGKVTRTFTGHFAQPYDMIMRRDGKVLFVDNENTGGGMSAAPGNGWLSVIDVKTGRVIKELPLGKGPTGMGAAGAR